MMQGYEVVITQTEGNIQCDFESAKAYLQEQLRAYDGMVFTEETKASAKSTVAELRKQKKALSDRVKEVRAEYMKPFEVFFEQAGELIDLYDQPISFINGQITAFEESRIEEKKKLIQQLYEEYIGDMSDVLPLEKIYNKKWENATTSRKAICQELVERKQAVKNALEILKGMESDAQEKAIQIYLDTFDLTGAMTHINQYEAQKREMLAREQERVRREEEARIRREERAKLEAERRAQEEKEAALRQAEEEKIAAVEAAREEAAQEVIDSLIAQGEGETSLYEYRLALSNEQKDKLEMYLDSVGIEWEMI